MDRAGDKEECVCISVSLHRHLCVNEFVSVCLANVTSQIRAGPPLFGDKSVCLYTSETAA